MNTKSQLLVAGMLLATFGTGLGQPIITQQPQSCTNAVGTTATFTVTATGTEPLAYQWQKYDADLAVRTNTTLVLTKVVSGDVGGYRVVVTNIEGGATSQVATLTVVASPPSINPITSFQHQAVDLGLNASFTAWVSGTALSYQWRLDGRDLPGKTKNILAVTNAQPADEGDYTLVVTNLVGAVTSEPARLYVVPPWTNMVKGNYTNIASLRLPYFYHVPAGYDPLRRYPLVILMHGTPGDENTVPPFLASSPASRVFASYNQQATDPVILVWPTRRPGDNSWTDPYLQQVSGLIDKLIADFSIDTNRVYVAGGSEGVHAAWDLVGMRPSFFAAACYPAGWSGATQPRLIKDVPTWVWCAANDDAGQLGNSQSLVQALRSAGGRPTYTEYVSGGHIDGIFMGMRTPVIIDWILAQRRGSACTNEPLISITSPTAEATFTTGALVVSLAGKAEALGQPVTKVTWKNNSTGGTGPVQGTNVWSASNIPLLANRTNTFLVTATTTSWAAGYGGNTTFIDTLTVVQSPLRATLTVQGTNAVLNWLGGGPPYRVQRATDLAAGDWTDLIPNATPPLPLPLPLVGGAGFYRIVGQ